MSEFKYLGCVLNESDIDGAKCRREVANGKRVAGTIRSPINAMSSQFHCDRVLHESLLVPDLTYGSETMIWREKEGSRVRAVQIDNLRGLLGIRKLHKVPNTRITEFCGMTKGINERIDEGVLGWFSRVERMEKDRIAKRVYVWECAGNR